MQRDLCIEMIIFGDGLNIYPPVRIRINSNNYQIQTALNKCNTNEFNVVVVLDISSNSKQYSMLFSIR